MRSNSLVCFKAYWRFWKNLTSEEFFFLFFTQNRYSDWRHLICRPCTGHEGKNYLKSCKLTKLQRHECASAARVRWLPSASAGLSRPFPAPSGPGAASAPLPPSPASRPSKSMIVYSFSKRANFPRAAQGLCQCSSSGKQWGRESVVRPSKIHTGAAARKATSNVMPVWCIGMYRKCCLGLADSNSERPEFNFMLHVQTWNFMSHV